jgi:hypothetical protein
MFKGGKGGSWDVFNRKELLTFASELFLKFSKCLLRYYFMSNESVSYTVYETQRNPQKERKR